jgi:O-acetylserine/cysteine efflux transporter
MVRNNFSLVLHAGSNQDGAVKPRDLALAVLVAAVWGVNFVAISIGLQDLPPLLFNALRFGLAAVPAVFFVGRPKVAWRWVIAIGLSLGVVKFSLLNFGMAAGMPAGLSSLVLQAQAVFTVIFAAVLLRERPVRLQLAGLAIAAVGLVLVGWRLGPDRPAQAFALVLAAAAAWGLSNVGFRRAAPADMLNFMVWVSAVAAPVLFVLTLAVDGPTADLAAIRSMSWASVGALLYIAGLSTLWGWAVWGALIRRHGASTVAPFSMLVPFFGVASAAIVLREPIHATDIVGAVLVIGGVLTGALAARSPAGSPQAPETAVPETVRVTQP